MSRNLTAFVMILLQKSISGSYLNLLVLANKTGSLYIPADGLGGLLSFLTFSLFSETAVRASQ